MRPPCLESAPASLLERGFTLVELLITVLVLSILLALAVPSFRSFMQNDTQWVLQNSLVLALNAARSEAIKQDSIGGVQVCASSDGATCNGANWGQGWIVLNPAAPAAQQVLQSVGAVPANNTLTEAGGNLSVTFFSNGTVNGAVAFRFCDIRGAAQARYLQVNAMGRVAVSPTVGQDLTGAALVCP
jgi:type IV fimbrial biogenesis protein FimT